MKNLKIKALSFCLIGFLALLTKAYAQVQTFNNRYPTLVLPMYNIDLPINKEIKVINTSNNQEVKLFDAIAKLQNKPSVIVTWSNSDELQNYHLQRLDSLVKLSNMNEINLVIINLNNYFNPASKSFPKNGLESKTLRASIEKKHPKWLEIPFYLGNLYEFNSFYGTTREPFIIYLDNQKKIISTTALSKDVYAKNIYQYITTFAKPPSGKYIFISGGVQIGDKDKADFYVARNKITETTTQIQYLDPKSKKVFFQINYSLNKPNFLLPLRPISCNGTFAYKDENEKIVFEGDCANDYLNNLTTYENNKIVSEMENFTELNENYLINYDEVQGNLNEEIQNFVKPANTLTPVMYSRYNKNGGKVVTEYNNWGKKVSEKNYYPNGKLGFEGNWTIKNWYYENGKIKESSFYVDGKKNGKCSKFYENGKLKSIDLYENGERKPQKGYQKFFENGSKMETRFLDGSEDHFYSNNQLMFKRLPIEQANNASETLFYPNGKVSTKIQFDANGYVTCGSKFYSQAGDLLNKPYVLNKLINTLFELYKNMDLEAKTDDNSITEKNATRFFLKDKQDQFNLWFPLDNKGYEEANGKRYQILVDISCD
ncbi:antitoxin component YwqK of YwqJK toxin-antitoxin module [Pedobacter sp. UYEF25]